MKGKVLQWKIEHDGKAQKNNAHEVLAQNPLCFTTLPLQRSLPFMVFHPLLNVRCLNNASLWASAISLQKYVTRIPQFSTALWFFSQLIGYLTFPVNKTITWKTGKNKRKEKIRLFPMPFNESLEF